MYCGVEPVMETYLATKEEYTKQLHISHHLVKVVFLMEKAHLKGPIDCNATHRYLLQGG